MLKTTITLLLLAGPAMVGRAQTTALFTVNQPPQLQVDAGDDLAYVPGLILQVAATGGTSTYGYLWVPAQYLNDPTSPTPEVQGLPAATLFTVQVTDLGMGCTLTDEVLVDVTTSISAMGIGNPTVFPNPSDGLVRIQTPVAIARVQLRSLNGALAMEHSGMPLRELVLDVSALPAGVYFMTIEFIDGRSNTHKLCATSAP